MKKLIVIAISIITLNSLAYAQEDKVLLGYIADSFKFYEYDDFNHKNKSKKIYDNFIEALNNYKVNNSNVDVKKIHIVLQDLYDSSYSMYEDSPDLRRAVLRRSICFATLALLSDYEKSVIFFDYAKYSLINKYYNKIEDLLVHNYIALIILELYIKKLNDDFRESELSKAQSLIKKHEEDISNDFKVKSLKMIDKIRYLSK